jgi:hypothetical protein
VVVGEEGEEGEEVVGAAAVRVVSRRRR